MVKNNYIFGIHDPYFPIHYAIFMGLRWRLRVVLIQQLYHWAVFGLVILACDLDLWPFGLVQWSSIAGHVIYTSTKFEGPKFLHSWVMTHDVSHRNALRAAAHVQYHVTCAKGRSNSAALPLGRFRPCDLSLWNLPLTFWPRSVIVDSGSRDVHLH